MLFLQSSFIETGVVVWKSAADVVVVEAVVVVVVEAVVVVVVDKAQLAE